VGLVADCDVSQAGFVRCQFSFLVLTIGFNWKTQVTDAALPDEIPVPHPDQ